MNLTPDEQELYDGLTAEDMGDVAKAICYLFQTISDLRAKNIELESERATAIRLRLEQVECENLLYATGHWTPNDERSAGVSVPEAIRALIAENQEIKQTLLNEQGKGEPPSPGWEWKIMFWKNGDFEVKTRDCVIVRWELWKGGVLLDEYPTARAAIRAAKEIEHGVPADPCPPPKRTCNLHNDCDAVDAAMGREAHHCQDAGCDCCA
jgi:hypothetical protein